MEQISESQVSFFVSAVLTDDEMNELCSACWPEHTPTQCGSVLARSLAYVTAHAGGILIGFVNLAWDGGEHAFLLYTMVNPDHRHNGIGTELVKRAIDEARRRNIKWVHVDFEPHLRRFYDNCGFRPTEAGLIRVKSN